LLHQKRAAEAAYDQATSQYRTTVIGAVQNVADSRRQRAEGSIDIRTCRKDES
jgi:outer membrane protein TolC